MADCPGRWQGRIVVSNQKVREVPEANGGNNSGIATAEHKGSSDVRRRDRYWYELSFLQTTGFTLSTPSCHLPMLLVAWNLKGVDMANTRRDEIQTTNPRGEEEDREEARQEAERDEQQDLNQGMDTGTRDSTRHGVEWGRAYRQKSRAGSKTTKPHDEKS